MSALVTTKIPGVRKLFSGRVRDVYSVDKEHLIIVWTDRISAFGHVFPNGVPRKGVILNSISNRWFSGIKFIKNHIVEKDYRNFPAPFCNHPEQLADRSALVRKAQRIDFKCVVRGYLTGSAWKEYMQTGEVCGIRLPPGHAPGQELAAPLFTPAARIKAGEYINTGIDAMSKKLGTDVTERLGELTFRLYESAREKLKRSDIILADSKFEFGFIGNEIILIDEVLTPDSSRFWDAEEYRSGIPPVSFDKRAIRDYIESASWSQNSPPPALPAEVIGKIRENYELIRERVFAVQ